METKRGNYFLLLATLLALTFFSYLNQFIFRYSVPPGLDAVPHNEVILRILEGDIGQIFRYHTIWHLITIVVSFITRLPSITAMAWIGPLLLVTCAASLYAFNRRFFGPIAGYTSLLLIGFASLQPLQTLFDGGFPNVLAAGTVLPFSFILLESIFNAQHRARAVTLFLISLFVLLYSHHLTTLYALGIIGLFIVVCFVKYSREVRINPYYIGCGIMGLVVMAWFALDWFLHTSLITADIQSFANDFIATSRQFPFFQLKNTLQDQNALWPISIYPREIGEAVITLGAAGWLAGIYFLKKRPFTRQWRAIALLVVWAGVLFWGSRMGALGYPVRLARDLAIPLALLAGVFVQLIWHYILDHKLPKWPYAVFIILCIFLAYPTTVKRFKIATNPSNLVHHLPVDSLAATYLEKNTPIGSTILVFHDDYYLGFFLPGRNVKWQLSPTMTPKLMNLVDLKDTLEGIDYVYLEERPDRQSSPINNTDITYNYLRSPAVKHIATFEQPEKKIYLFKVVDSVK